MTLEQKPQEEFPDTTRHIGDAINGETSRLETLAREDQAKIAAEEAARRARELLTRETDLANEAAAAHAEGLDLTAYNEEIGGDPGVEAAIKVEQDIVQAADVERRNLPRD